MTISDDHNLYRSLYHATCFLPAESTCVKSGAVIAATTEMFSVGRNDNLRDLELFVDFYFA